MRRHLVAALTTWIFSTGALSAGAPLPVSLEPVTHETATLVIVGADGSERTYTPAELEAFPTYAITTATPWREEPAEFVGVLLSDLLAAHGLDSVDAILVTAENDYDTIISQDLVELVQIMVATRVNGRAHSRRERGPLQFVIDQEAFQLSPLTSESNFVWMAARIEAAD